LPRTHNRLEGIIPAVLYRDGRFEDYLPVLSSAEDCYHLGGFFISRDGADRDALAAILGRRGRLRHASCAEYYTYQAAGEPKFTLTPADAKWYKNLLGEAEAVWASAIDYPGDTGPDRTHATGSI
jgi:hypothetical protein